MQVDPENRKAINGWIAQSKQEGWKHPRDVAENCRTWDPFDEATFGYCDGCHRTYADSFALDRVKEALHDEPPGTFQSLFEGGT